MPVPEPLVKAAAEAACPIVCNVGHEVGYGYCWEAAKAGLAAAFAALDSREAAEVIDDAMYEWSVDHGVPAAGEGRIQMVRHGLRALDAWSKENADAE